METRIANAIVNGGTYSANASGPRTHGSKVTGADGLGLGLWAAIDATTLVVAAVVGAVTHLTAKLRSGAVASVNAFSSATMAKTDTVEVRKTEKGTPAAFGLVAGTPPSSGWVDIILGPHEGKEVLFTWFPTAMGEVPWAMKSLSEADLDLVGIRTIGEIGERLVGDFMVAC